MVHGITPEGTGSCRSKLEQRVISAADAVLKADGAVGPIELMVRLGFLERVHLDGWRRGNPCFKVLEDHIQCGEKKLAVTFRFFEQWIEREGLEAAEAIYQGSSRRGARELRIIADENPKLEEFYRTRYQRADQSAARKKQIERKLNKAPDLVVFVITGEGASCSECGSPIDQGDRMFREDEQPLCLACADLDHLLFLPSGDATLTRRAKKFSLLSAVVVQFNRRRKRYDRQGLLVTEAAIRQAEESMEADADKRAKQRVVSAIRRVDEDEKLVESIMTEICDQFPSCAVETARMIAQHTALRGSGRVGRSAAGRAVDQVAVKLAVIAHVRHEHTDYDRLLMEGVARQDARREIQASLNVKLNSWRSGVARTPVR